jgi:hypothetical protein
MGIVSLPLVFGLVSGATAQPWTKMLSTNEWAWVFRYVGTLVNSRAGEFKGWCKRKEGVWRYRPYTDKTARYGDESEKLPGWHIGECYWTQSLQGEVPPKLATVYKANGEPDHGYVEWYQKYGSDERAIDQVLGDPDKIKTKPDGDEAWIWWLPRKRSAVYEEVGGNYSLTIWN